MTTHRPRISVPITKSENINASSNQPRVTRPLWNPAAGQARQKEIEEARQQAWEEHQKQLANQTPLAMRVSYLEAVVTQLQTELKELKSRSHNEFTSSPSEAS